MHIFYVNISLDYYYYPLNIIESNFKWRYGEYVYTYEKIHLKYRKMLGDQMKMGNKEAFMSIHW